MNGKELKKKCESLGWYLVRTQGSHHVLKHPDRPDVLIIPIHGGKDIKKGLLHKLMKQAGLK